MKEFDPQPPDRQSGVSGQFSLEIKPIPDFQLTRRISDARRAAQ